MTAITRKTRTVEYFEVKGRECAKLQDAITVACYEQVHPIFKDWAGVMLDSSTVDQITRFVIQRFPELKAIIEGVRLEEEEAPGQYKPLLFLRWLSMCKVASRAPRKSSMRTPRRCGCSLRTWLRSASPPESGRGLGSFTNLERSGDRTSTARSTI